MTNNGHRMTGLSVGIGYGGYLLLTQPSFSVVMMFAILPAAFFGGTAPDRLEWFLDSGKRWVTHRTWTHWTLLWVAPLVMTHFHYFGLPAPAQEVLIAFLLGGVSHLLTDLPNPTGIPLLTPYHRISLKMWKSGQMEWLMIPLFLVGGFYPWLLHFDVISYLERLI